MGHGIEPVSAVWILRELASRFENCDEMTRWDVQQDMDMLFSQDASIWKDEAAQSIVAALRKDSEYAR